MAMAAGAAANFDLASHASKIAANPAVSNGSAHQTPSAANSAASAGASAVPRPSSALSVSTAASARSAARRSTRVLRVVTVAPKPRPSAAVAQHSSAKAAESPISSALPASSDMASRSAPRPSDSRPRIPNRRASQGPSAAANMAEATCGTNIAPYWALDKWKPVGPAKIALAAGKATSARPCIAPQR